MGISLYFLLVSDGEWCGREEVRCLPQQLANVTESSYNNSLADHHIWSTIKTLPATLPEPSFEGQEPTLSNIATATSALGSSNRGLLRAFLNQIWT